MILCVCQLEAKIVNRICKVPQPGITKIAGKKRLKMSNEIEIPYVFGKYNFLHFFKSNYHFVKLSDNEEFNFN